MTGNTIFLSNFFRQKKRSGAHFRSSSSWSIASTSFIPSIDRWLFRVHGVLGRGEDVSHTPSSVRFALPSVRKMLEKNSSPKTMANFWQQKSSCFYPTSWFMVQPPNFRCDSLGCFVGKKKSVWETKIRKAKNVWTLFWFWSLVHLRWKFKRTTCPKAASWTNLSPHIWRPFVQGVESEILKLAEHVEGW